MRIAYIADNSKNDTGKAVKRRVVKKSFKQLADEALEERRAFDRQRAKKQNAAERAEMERLIRKLNQLKAKKYEQDVQQS